MSAPALCVAIHDVAPATWPQCLTLLAMLERIGAPPLTLLTVPDYHHRGLLDGDRRFVRAIDARVARGDEVALHGYFHLDDALAPRTLSGWFRRRVLTASEGEFQALAEDIAARRICDGLALCARLGWNVRGFVAPAWLLGDGARRALARSRLQYTCTHGHIEPLRGGAAIPAPAISVSARSPWRRAASRAWLNLAAPMLRTRPLLRIALHPADAHHPDLLAGWSRLIAELLASHVPMTKSEALAHHLAATATHRPDAAG